MNKSRFLALAISFSGFIFLYVLKEYYRPVAYREMVNDFYFADTFPSLLSMPTIYAFIIFLNPISQNKVSYIIILTFFSILYEVNSNVFDWLDVVAIIIGSLITYVLKIVFNSISK